jgi:hypothetical protein
MVIATTPIPVETYLDQYPDQNSEDLKTARSVLDAAKKVVFGPAKPDKEEAKKRDRVKGELLKVSQAFARLSGGPPKPSDYPERVIKYSGPPPKRNTIQYLSGTAKGGSKPGRGPDTGTTGWKKVFELGLTTASDKWVQMHVLSEVLGGEGIATNLIPAPNSVNSGPFRSFERATYDLARKKNKEIKNVLWVDVSVSYYAGDEYASSISGNSGLYFWRGENTKWVKHESPSLSSKASIPRPDLHIEDKVSLNLSSGTHLRKVINDTTLVDVIRDNRPFKSIPDFKARVTAAAEARSVSRVAQKVGGILTQVSNKKIVLNNVSET